MSDCKTCKELDDDNFKLHGSLFEYAERVTSLCQENARLREALSFIRQWAGLPDDLHKRAGDALDARQAQKDVSGDTSDPAKYQKQAPGDNTAQVRCVGCSGILIQQNLCHDCAETTQVCAHGREMLNECSDCGRVPSATASNDTAKGDK